MGTMRSLLPLLSLVAVLLPAARRSNSLQYNDRRLFLFNKVPNSLRLTFKTKRGRQVAYYVGPRKGASIPPDPLVVWCPGVASRALDRLDWVLLCPDSSAGWLLVDYPGRGECEGLFRPWEAATNAHRALDELAGRSGIGHELLTANPAIVGHSLGAAVALKLATEVPPRRLVLISPFTTLRRAMFRRVGPLAYLLPGTLDNLALLKTVLQARPAPAVVLIHGQADKIVPLSTSLELQLVNPHHVVLHQIPGGTHVSVLTSQRDMIFHELFGSCS